MSGKDAPTLPLKAVGKHINGYWIEDTGMYIREYGQEHKRALLFFPGSCEPWEEFSYAAKELAEAFHVLLVIPDGQDPEEHTDFISVEKTVDDTASWLKEHGIDHLAALYGLSYGGGMVTRFLATQDIPVEKAIIDAGTAPYTYPKWICKLICIRDYLMLKLGRASVAAMKADKAKEPYSFSRRGTRGVKTVPVSPRKNTYRRRSRTQTGRAAERARQDAFGFFERAARYGR